MDYQTHYCDNPSEFPLEKFHQIGSGKGKGVLVVGESPAPNGWRLSGKACYDINGKLLATGNRLNEVLFIIGLTVEKCGFTELAKCYVGKDRKRLEKCCLGCWQIFVKQLESVNYKVIIILGVETLRIFNKLNNSNLKVGELTKSDVNGKEYWILPIFHPSPINPHGRKKNHTIFELQKRHLIVKLNDFS